MILVSNNSANQNTVLEANLTETGAVGAANSQNVLAFGLQSGHTQIDGSPITFTGQCGAANALSVTLSSYTWNPAPTANTAGVATSNISLNFTEGSVAFSGTATGVIGSAYPFGWFSGTYSSSTTGTCFDAGTWTATSYGNGNLGAYTPGVDSTLPATADPNCPFADGSDGVWNGQTEGGEGIQRNPDQFIAGLWCGNPNTNGDESPFLQYTANGNVVGQMESGPGQKVLYPQGPHVTTGAGTPQVVDTFDWFVFGVFNSINASNINQQQALMMYAYNTDGTFVTSFNGTCADAPDSTGTNCN
jgi:hypothetical protein